MKTTFIPNMEICNSHGHEQIADAFFMDDGNGNRRVILFSPGTTTEIEEVPYQSSAGLDLHIYEEAEQDAWWEQAEIAFSREERFISAVEELIVADEERKDTSGPARTIREHLTDNLGRPDPLDSERLPDRNDILDLGECIGEWPCGEDNEGHEAEYIYEGKHYILGHDERRTWYHLKEDEDESPNSDDSQGGA